MTPYDMCPALSQMCYDFSCAPNRVESMPKTIQIMSLLPIQYLISVSCNRFVALHVSYVSGYFQKSAPQCPTAIVLLLVLVVCASDVAFDLRWVHGCVPFGWFHVYYTIRSQACVLISKPISTNIKPARNYLIPSRVDGDQFCIFNWLVNETFALKFISVIQSLLYALSSLIYKWREKFF